EMVRVVNGEIKVLERSRTDCCNRCHNAKPRQCVESALRIAPESPREAQCERSPEQRQKSSPRKIGPARSAQNIANVTVHREKCNHGRIQTHRKQEIRGRDYCLKTERDRSFRGADVSQTCPLPAICNEDKRGKDRQRRGVKRSLEYIEYGAVPQ